MQLLPVPLTHQLSWCHTKPWEESNPAPKHPEQPLHHNQAPSWRHSMLCNQIPTSSYPIPLQPSTALCRPSTAPKEPSD